MYIGVDAGGTKTDICVCDTDGRVLARERSAGINAAREGVQTAAGRLAALLRGMGGERARRVYAGVAGAGSGDIAAQLRASVAEALGLEGRVEVRSDAFNAMNIVCGLGDGVALIAGTGSAAFVRVSGRTEQVGGRGYLIDDAGSGYWVGRACLNAVFRHLDGRGPATALTGAAGEDIARRIPEIYEKGPSFVAGFAPLVFECALGGDAVARAIAEDCVRELGLLMEACAGKPGRPEICVISGGLANSPYLRAGLSRRAEELGLQPVWPEMPPVCGAVIAAAALDGVDLKGRLHGL